MKVGSKIWIFNSDHRVYRPGSMGPPIWREYWEEKTITGETRISWLVGPKKISKKDLAAGKAYGILASQEDVDAAC
jgi:hypothetical protein